MLHDITIQTQGICTSVGFWRLSLRRQSQRSVKFVDWKERHMTKGSNFWVIGGEFGSMNFHKLVEGSAQVQGPFKTRKEAEDAWRTVSEENRHKAGVRFSIVEEPNRAPAA
jgi:hypothetical protein